MTATNQNYIHKEIKSRLNSGSACYHSGQNLIFPYPLVKVKDWNLLFCMGVKFGLWH